MDKEKIRQIIVNMETLGKNGQELARSCMDKEPSQRSQNNNWRYLLQELRDLKKAVFGEDAV